ncbi:MAG TPA: FliA/WhiG family RNA polymerase sigma factor [Acidimicrobiales bacterium]|jgi:RNA polymerase sigma factor for flagellar operon FliA
MLTHAATAHVDAEERAREIEQLWTRLRHDGDRTAIAELANLYYPLVQHVTRSTARGLSKRAEVDDLQGYGAEGLLDAIERFDPARGVQFTTFAAHRIRGAIYDGIRGADWAPRSVRRKERALHENESHLLAEHGRPPTEQEEAGGLGLDVATLRAHKVQVSNAYVDSLDGLPGGDDLDPLEAIVDDRGEPLAAVVAEEVTRTLATALSKLDDRERTVVSLSFEKGMTLAEVGRVLGVTESRVCQIRGQAVKRLRDYIYAHGMAPG